MASPPLSFPVTGHSAKILCSAAAAEMGAILWERVCCSGCSSQLAKHARETGSSGNTKGLCYRNLHGDLTSISLAGRTKRMHTHPYIHMEIGTAICREVFVSSFSASNIPCSGVIQIFLFLLTNQTQLLNHYYYIVYSKINLEN